jgi:AraC-like DNA-binding protein
VIEEGMGFFFEKNIPHEYYAVQEPWETRWITFDGYAVPELLGLLGFKPWNVFRLKGRLQLEKILQDIYSTGISRNIGRNYECSSLLYQFLLNAGNSMGRDSGKAARSLNRQLQSVLLYIDESYGKPVSLDNMAEKAEISKQHLCRLFRQAFNMSPFEYLTRYRIQKAKEYILLPGGPKLKEVAAAVGYNDASYFCAVFRELEGLTPSQFKNMYRMP